MKKDLLVTLADKNYMDQAKQLFSSVYWNAGWRGDYMLLAHEIPDEKLKWFRDKGILIKKCSPICDKKLLDWSTATWSKFYLFTPEFKKWKNIIFLDAAIIVRASLDELTKINGFAARYGAKLGKEFIKPRFMSKNTKFKAINIELFDELRKNYNLKEQGFNAGVMVFNTDVLKDETFAELKRLTKLYGKIRRFRDQPILNLFFYKKFTPLPYVYNCNIDYSIYVRCIKPEKIKGIILHFIDRNKPWLPKNPFYKEWKNNLCKAELIDLNKIPPPRERWTEEDIKKYCQYLGKRRRKYIILKYVIWVNLIIGRAIGVVGIFLKHNFPKLYYKIKELR
jgi:lipopolysaccharide biosynthesis glycosyltransferase